jgi:glutaredoxin
MRKITFAFLMFIMMTAFWGDRSHAEVITLRDGRRIEGTVIENRDDYITVKVKDREDVIRKNKIDKIEAQAGSGNLQLARTPAPVESAKKVKLYMTSWCSYCRQMEQFLIASKIPYKRLDIENNATASRDYTDLGGEGVPLIVVNETIIAGYDPESVQAAWDDWNNN